VGDTSGDTDRLPEAEFAFPGPLRDRLVDAILRGDKVSTTGLARSYALDAEPLPEPGQRFAVVDSSGRRVAVIEVTSVRVVALKDVDLAHCLDEGEGYATVRAWRDSHEAFWRRVEVLAELGGTAAIDDSTPVVLERFRLVARFEGTGGSDLPERQRSGADLDI